MLGRFLCWLGFHDESPTILIIDHPELTQRACYCRRCSTVIVEDPECR